MGLFEKKDIPVYMFNGFLDSGKTSMIREILNEGQYEDGFTTLFVCCEEGEEELDEVLLKKNKFKKEVIEDEEDVSKELLESFDKKNRPHRVVIEANGMWDLNELVAAFPSHWIPAEIITTVDSTTFESYLANMKMMMTNQFRDSNLVLFNRCREDHDRAMFKRMVRAVNRMGQVLFETPDGQVDDDAHEEPPYDMTAPVIEIADDDFGIFYIDALDHLDRFLDKTVRFKGQVFHPKKAKDDVFVPGRYAMTCCAEDVAFVGFPCKYDEASLLKDKDWVYVTAKVGSAYSRQLEDDAPILKAVKIEKAEKAEEDIVYFN